jgi:carboxylesterase type B
MVQTSSGRIHGFVDPKYPSVSQFLNVPFAQAPLGELRFAPPAPLTTKAANQDIDASKFGPVCLQYNPTAGRATLYDVYNPNYLPTPAVVNASSEDCLSLAIWAPTITKKHDALPILVWFYGGGFGKGGTNAAYFNASPWINRTQSHIVVAANYRTGFLGNPNSAGLANQGKNLNVGQLDQRLIVEWVNSNIAKFGGDPSRITIWGQSAGSISVDMYNFAYANHSLVTGLIMSSGTTLYPRENNDLTHSNFTYAANHLGCSTKDPIAELNCMRKVPSSKFKAFIQDLTLPGTMDFYPVIDNVTKFPISTYPQRIKDGKFSKKVNNAPPLPFQKSI